MIRVREGTVLDVTVRNALADSTLKAIGLRSRPDPTHDTLQPAERSVATGETFDSEFVPARGEYLLTAMFDDTRPGWHQRIMVR
jgi:hypothetical protein